MTLTLIGVKISIQQQAKFKTFVWKFSHMGRRPVLNPSQVNELYRDLKKNLTGQQLAEKYKVTRAQLYATYGIGKKKNKGQSFEGLFPFPGSKKRLLQAIIRKSLVLKSSQIIEPCSGSAAFSMNITSSEFVLNDLDENVVNLLATLKNKCAAKEMETLLKKFTLLSELAQREKFKKIIRDESNDIKRANALYLTLQCGFGGVLRYNANGELNTPFAKPYKHNHQKYLRSHELLAQKNPLLTNLDMLDCIAKNLANGKNKLFFIDPPYVDSPSLYKTKFSAKKLVDLYEACLSIKKSKNNFILTFSEDNFALSLFEEFKIRKILNSYGIRGQKTATDIVISSF